MNTEKIKRKSGFTLLETMIYLVILTAVFGFLFLTWQELNRFFARERAAKEIHSTALFLSEYLSDAIRQAKSISEPGPGSQSSALRFGGSGCGGGVSIVWEGGDLFQEENGQKEKLNPDNIIIASLSFSNRGGNNFDSISADALLKYKNPTELALLDKEFSLKFSSVNKQGWSCGAPLTDYRDGKTYDTVCISNQCWMKQNLNVGTKVSGQTNNGIVEKYCYSGSDANCDSNNPNYPDGGLYRWDEAMQYSSAEGGQGICLSGWHIPTDAEWCVLEQAVDPTIACNTTGGRGTDGGVKLKPNGSSGFEGNLAGFQDYRGIFSSRQTEGYFWSSSASGNIWARQLDFNNAKVSRSTLGSTYGASVRCVKD